MRAAEVRLLAVLLLAAGGCAGVGNGSPAGLPRSSEGLTPEERLGIRVEALRISAQGFMLDFRFRVIDPERAGMILDRAVKPYVIDEASGAKFLIPSSPKVGPMRQTTRRPESGRIYWLLFANPAGFIKPGNSVTVVVGEIRLEHLIVE